MSIAGLDSERAWKLRGSINFNDTTQLLSTLVLSLTGLDSERAWKLRELFEFNPALSSLGSHHKNKISKSLAKSYAGLNSAKAWEFRSRLEEGVQNTALFYSLAGLNSQRSWDLRLRLLKDAHSKNISILIGNDFAESLNGNFVTAIGWRTAKKYQKKQP